MINGAAGSAAKPRRIRHRRSTPFNGRIESSATLPNRLDVASSATFLEGMWIQQIL